MSTTTNTAVANQNTEVSQIKDMFQTEKVKMEFDKMLGKNSSAFITSVLQIVNSNNDLKNSEPSSVVNAAITAAALNLPINNNLGFAHIVSYKKKQPDGTYKSFAQFQIGYKGFIQLAQRSDQFKIISCAVVYEGQLQKNDPLYGCVFDWNNKISNNAIGYVAMFQLLNGFEKMIYMSKEELQAHGSEYSKTYSSDYGLWKTKFDAMAQKTVLKLLLSKYAPLSIEMQKAQIADQSIIKNISNDTIDVEYVDNDNTQSQLPKENEGTKRLIAFINKSTTLLDLKKFETEIKGIPEAEEAFSKKFISLKEAR